MLTPRGALARTSSSKFRAWSWYGSLPAICPTALRRCSVTFGPPPALSCRTGARCGHSSGVATLRWMVTRRSEDMAKVAHDFTAAGTARRERYARLLGEVEQRLEEREAEELPFAEQLYLRRADGPGTT